MKRAIEEYFPIVDVNHLAIPERNAFKPIYTMHKWFARRSSSVFRAILLSALKPAGTDIMKEFYKDHTNDVDTKDKLILDPFMGGGTTVVEALRLGCNVTGIDLNPISWFIVKTEVGHVDIDELKQAFERLSNRIVEWSGKPLKESLLELYRTECPCCGSNDADIIYTFWVKSAPCTTATCSHKTPLFSDYIIVKKNPTIRYYEDCECPKCKNKFDIEIEPASLIGSKDLMINASKYSAGIGRAGARWEYLEEENKIKCPWCDDIVFPPIKGKKKRKKVYLNVLLCPNCEEVWQYRGELNQEDKVVCPSCRKEYKPFEGNVPTSGKFICRGSCNGNLDSIINSIRKLSQDEKLSLRPYAIEGYCEKCAGKDTTYIKKKNPFFEFDNSEYIVSDNPTSNTLLKKNNGKFFKRFSATDLSKYNDAKDIWNKKKKYLPYPKSKIPIGEKTKSGLIAHHFNYWYDMFNERQLLALSTLLNKIDEEESQILKEMLLSAFFSALETSNLFTRYHSTRFLSAGVFARHDYQPKITICENNVWGTKYGNQTFRNTFDKVLEGKIFGCFPEDSKYENGVIVSVVSTDSLCNNTDTKSYKILSQSSLNLNSEKTNCYDFIITDPPYAGNVNYSELADFFYVWLRLVLKKVYPHFQPEYTPKTEEVIENKTRGKTANDFKEGLKTVFGECFRTSKDDALLIFTFHHADDSAWESLLGAVCEAGYYIEAVYPINGEAENSLHLMDNEAISYDLIHVCKKRQDNKIHVKRAWAGIRKEIRQKAREEQKVIESGRYGNERLSSPDINILLIGKCLELYSKYYGGIVDFQDVPVPIHKALEEIKMMVDQLITKEYPLPPELEDIDVPSYIYFTALCRNKEISSDNVSKSVRGIIDSSELKDLGLIIKGREKRGRTFEIKQPIDRLNDLKIKYKIDGQPGMQSLFTTNESSVREDFIFVDIVHLLLGLAETGESVQPCIERFSGLKPQIRSAMEYLKKANKNFNDSANRILAQLDVTTLFTKNK